MHSIPLMALVERTHWLTVLAVGVALTSGCQAPPQVSESSSGATTVSRTGRDLTTASDETEGRRRARVRLELAGAYSGQGQYTTALDEVKQALALDNAFVDAFELRGLIYDALSEPSLSDDSFKRALQLDERNGSVLHNYAWSLCRRQQYAVADAYFARAADLPLTVGTPKALLARGVCQTQAGLLPEAEKTLIRAYELTPSNPAMAYNLALVLYKRGEYERARFYARRLNAVPDQVNPESLWLALRIEHKMSDTQGRDDLAHQLRSRFSTSQEVNQLELGRYDD